MPNRSCIWVEFKIHPPSPAQLMALVLADGKGSLTGQPGCLQFDMLAPEDDVISGLPYETCTDKVAFQKHLAAPHFKEFASTTFSMIAGRKVRARQLHADSPRADNP